MNSTDLLGNRVNIGNPGSGQRALMEVVMEHKGWSTDDFALASELAPAEMGQALCDNNIDAFVFTVGHPSGAIQEVTSTCDVRIVNADDDELMALVDEIPFYFPATIPAGMYRGTDEDVQTFGVGATFVSSADVDDDVVYTLVASVFDNLDDFRSLQSGLRQSRRREQMATQGMSAPMHPGAERYFPRAGPDRLIRYRSAAGGAFAASAIATKRGGVRAAPVPDSADFQCETFSCTLFPV